MRIDKNRWAEMIVWPYMITKDINYIINDCHVLSTMIIDDTMIHKVRHKFVLY